MGQTSAWQRCPPSPIRRLAEITLCQNAPHAPHIALETGGKSATAGAEALACGLAIAQFAIRSQQIKCEKARRNRTPGIHRLYALALIYGQTLKEILSLYGIPL